MTECSTLQSQAASAHHCCDQEAQVQRTAVTFKSQEAGATASSCSFASTASPLLPVLSTSSSLTPGTNHQLLVHLWCFIPEHQEKAPNHSTSGRIQTVSLLPSLVPQRFHFYPLSFFLPLSLFFFKEVPSKTQSGLNTPLVCHLTVLPADLSLCGMGLSQLVCKPLREDI